MQLLLVRIATAPGKRRLCALSRAGLLVEEVQSSLRGGPGQLVHPRCDALVQIPQSVVEEPALLLIQGSQHLLSQHTLKVPP